MKIKVKDLKPNPFRDLDKYKIDPYKVDALAISIKETSFWDNILARPNDEFYQIAYGHHRLLAIQKVGLKEIDIPVRELDDDIMIQIMANENMEHWGSDNIIIRESVRVARDRLNSIIRNINDFKELQLRTFKIKNANPKIIEIIRENYKNKENFNAIRQKIRENKGSVGMPIVKTYLGNNWSPSKVSEALTQLGESEGMQEAAKEFNTQTDVQEFRKVIKKDFKGKIPEGKEKEIAKKVVKEIEKKKEIIKKEVHERKKKGEKTDNIRGHGHRQDMKTFTRMAVENISEKEAKLKDIELEFKRFDERVRSAYIGSRDLNLLLRELDIQKLEGLKSLFILDNVSDLLKEIKKTLTFFGFDYKNLQIGG